MSGCEYIVRKYSVSMTACFIARQLEGQKKRRWNRERLGGHQRATASLFGFRAARAHVSGPESSPEQSGWSSGAVDGRTGRYEPGRFHHAAPPLLQVSRRAVHLPALCLAHPSQPILQGGHFLLCLAEAEPRPPASLGPIGRPLWLGPGRDMHLCVPAASPLLLRSVFSAGVDITVRTHWHAHDRRLAGHRPGALRG
mgnify:CR=1 FL=1